MHLKLILQKLSHYQPVLLPITSPCAAVMIILLINEENVCDIVLTERAATLPTFAGDYSFPGGLADNQDKNLYETASREVQEELNIATDAYQFIGQLDDFYDRYQRLVRPFVVQMTKQQFEQQHRISLVEIEKLYYFPITKLNEIQDDPLLHAVTRRRPSYSFRDGSVFVWGLTAAILVHFANIILNQTKSLSKQ